MIFAALYQPRREIQAEYEAALKSSGMAQLRSLLKVLLNRNTSNK